MLSSDRRAIKKAVYTLENAPKAGLLDQSLGASRKSS